jgi:gamma-F420-2:alpha-L-glutamate ligase
MRCWILFQREVAPGVPEAREIARFQEVARRENVELSVLRPRDFELVVESGAEWSAVYRGRPLPKPDFILPRTGSETTYFTLAVLRHFERQGVAVVNRSTAIEAVADKLHTLQVLSRAGLPIPKTVLAKFPVDVDLVERELGFPVVVKTIRGTRGNGVLLCEDRRQFDDLAGLLDGANPSADFIFQRYVRASHGRDVRVLVVDGCAVAAMERRAANGGFKSNISLGGHGAAYAMPPEVAALALQVAQALDLEIAGIDILFEQDGYSVCEANSAPGFEGLEKACGVDVPEVVYAALRARIGLPAVPARRTLRARVAGAWRRWWRGGSTRAG